MGVGLKPHLPDGTYTGTYRVISADTHIVYGGLVFSIGHAGAAPKFTVAGLIGKNESGEVTRVAFGVVRGLNYLTLALMVGGLASPVLRVDARAWRSRRAARSAGHLAAQRSPLGCGRLFAVAIVLGVIVSVLGVLLQGASAAGVSLWSSLKSSIIEDTLEQPLRQGVGSARHRLAAARRAAARGQGDRQGRDPAPARASGKASRRSSRLARRA